MRNPLSTLVILLTLLTSPASAQTRIGLDAGVTIEVTNDEPIALEAEGTNGWLMRLEALQSGANVAIAVYQGDLLIDRIADSSPPATEALEWIAAPELSVRIEPATGSRGEVTLRLSGRPATPLDIRRVEGLRLAHAADRLMNEERAEAQAEAIASYERAVEMLRGADAGALARALDGLAWAISMAGEKRRALPLAEEALAFRREAGDADGEASTLQMIGLLHLWLGNWQESLETNEAVLALARASGNRAREAGVLHNIGGIHWSIDQMERALDFYRQALQVGASHVNDRSRASTLNNIGDTYRRLGDFETALEYFSQAFDLRVAAGDRSGQAHSLHTMGLVHLETGDAERARDHFTRALEIRKDVGDARGEAYSTGGLGAALFQLGKSEEALAYQKTALEKWSVVGERRAEAETRYNMGRTLNALGRREEALAALRLALPVSEQLSDHTTEAEIWLAIATTQRDAGDLEAARTSVDRAIEVIDRLRAGIASSELRTSYFARVRRFYDFYVDLLMRLEEKNPGEGWAIRAFETSERAKGRTFLETLAMARVDIREGVDRELLASETDLVRRIRMLERTRAVLLESGAGADELETAESGISSLVREHDELVAKIRRNSPAYAHLVMPEPVTWAELRELLAPDVVLLAAHVGDESGFVWFASRDGSLESRRLPGRDAIEGATRSLHDALTARSRTVVASEIAEADRETSERAALIASWLTPPAEMTGTKLLVVPDGALHYVPIAMLPGTAGQPLLRDYEIVTVPSVSVLAALSQRSALPASDDRVAIFADPVFRSDDPRVVQADRAAASGAAEDVETAVLRSAADSGLAALPRLRFSRREAAAIAALAGAGATQALDFDASRSRVQQLDLRDYATLHFATHGLINSREPALSGLVLSLVGPDGEVRNGFLSLQEIYNLDLSARLVVLSACQTALGDEVRGEGLVGLTRGFMYAGANSVVASLWQVDDRATSLLMENLYGQMLRDGLAPAAALRAAQLEMAGQDRWAAPYYWAAFQVQGDPEPK